MKKISLNQILTTESERETYSSQLGTPAGLQLLQCWVPKAPDTHFPDREMSENLFEMVLKFNGHIWTPESERETYVSKLGPPDFLEIPAMSGSKSCP